jgi:hypothetical protein
MDRRDPILVKRDLSIGHKVREPTARQLQPGVQANVEHVQGWPVRLGEIPSPTPDKRRRDEIAYSRRDNIVENHCALPPSLEDLYGFSWRE